MIQKKGLGMNEEVSVNMLKEIYACANGTCIPLSEVSDETFSSGMLGKGVGIIPKDPNIVSPVDGTITMVFDTKHALGIVTDDGIELMIHIGIDTVNLNGSFFEPKVKEGDRVSVGQLLIQCDLEQIAKNYDTTTMLIVTNTDDFLDVLPMNVGKEIAINDQVLSIKQEEKEVSSKPSEPEQPKENKTKTSSKILAWFQGFGR